MTNDGVKVRKLTGPEGHPYEIYEVPNTLKAKAGGFRVDPGRVGRIEAKLASLAERYPALIADDLARLHEVSAALRANPADEALRERFSKLGHDFKGQGGSFGYPLVSTAATSLCLLVHYGDFGQTRTLLALDIHVRAIDAIVANKLTGDGGEAGATLKANLRALLEACCPDHAKPEIWR